MLDYKYWFSQALSVVAILVTIWVSPPSALVIGDGAVAGRSLWPYLPFAAVTLMAIVNFVILAKQKRQGKGPFLRGMVLTGHGNRGVDTVKIIRANSMRDFRKDYNFAVAVGILDSTQDKFEDERMAMSNPFSISNDEVEVLIPHAGPLQDGINAEQIRQNPHLAPNVAGFRQLPKRRRQRIPVRLTISSWSEVVLLPKGVDPKSVRRLSDVRRLNGKILSEELAEGRITQTW